MTAEEVLENKCRPVLVPLKIVKAVFNIAEVL